MDALMQNPFKFHSAAEHFRHLLPATKLLNILTILNAYKMGNIHIMWHWGIFMQPLLHWKSNKYYIFWVCVCSLRTLVRNDHAPYCYMVPVRLHYIFPNYLINGKVIEHKMCVLIFSKTFVLAFLILQKTEQNMMKNVSWSSCKVPVIIVRF